MSKFIAIDLDPQGVFAVAGAARGGRAAVEQAVAWDGPEAAGGPPPLTAETAKRLGEQFRERLRAAGAGQAPALVSIPRDRVILKELRYPRVPPAEEPNLVRFQAVKELTDSPDDVVLDYVPLAGPADGERRSMAVAVRKDLYAAVQAFCSAANLRLAAVTPRPYAVAAGLARAAAADPAGAPGEAVAALTLGPGGGEFTVASGGEVTFTRTVPGPVVGNAALLLAEVRRNLTVYAGANPGTPIGALYVAEVDGPWAAKLGAALGLPVRAYDPLAGAAADVAGPARGRFAGAAGLLAARAAGDPPINFAAPRQPRAEANPNRGRVMLAALAALVLAVGGAAYGFFTLESADNEVAQLTADRDTAKKRWESLEPEAKRLAAADGWRARRVVWLDELYDMTDRFPVAGGFTAKSFSGKAPAPAPGADAKGKAKPDIPGSLEVKLTARAQEPVTVLFDAVRKDAVDPAPVPKGKAPLPPFYSKADFTFTPKDEQGVVRAVLAPRPPEKYVRAAAPFPVPSRKNYPPPAATAKEKEAAKEPEKPKEPEKKEPEKPATAPEPKAVSAG
jgi:hypothetical protein